MASTLRRAAPDRVAADRAAGSSPGEIARGFGFLAVTALGWGLNWPMVKFLLTQLPPFTMRAVGGAVGCAVTFAGAAWLGERLRVPAGQIRPLAISALLNLTSFAAASTFAMIWLPASEAVIIAYTLPLWASLLAWPILGERPTAARLVALVLGLGGIVVLMGGHAAQASWSRLPGVALGLGGAVLFALGTVLSKRRPLALPPVAAVAWQLGIASVPLAIPALFEHPDWARVTSAGWGGMAYLSLVPLSLAYITWFRALRLLPASTAASAMLIVPVIGVFGSALLIGEPLGARQLGALAMTLAGVGLTAWAARA